MKLDQIERMQGALKAFTAGKISQERYMAEVSPEMLSKLFTHAKSVKSSHNTWVKKYNALNQDVHDLRLQNCILKEKLEGVGGEKIHN